MTTGEIKILVGYDGSDDGVAALQFAASEAVARGGRLSLVFSVDDTMLNSAWGIVFDVEAVRQGGLDLLQEARDQAHARGVPLERIDTDCVLGQPGAVLSRLSQEASLVVVGRRSEGGEGSAFVGSTAVGLAGTAGCPVVVVAHGQHADAPKRVIGVGLDPGAHGMVAVDWALMRAKRLGARIIVRTIVRPPTSRFFSLGSGPSDEQKRTMFDGVRAVVDPAVEAARQELPGVPVEVQYRYGSPSDELVELSKECDLLILGVHPSFPTYSVGGTVRAAMTHSACPLGLIRHK